MMNRRVRGFGGMGELRISNDVFGDGGDGFRTAAGQLSWDNYSVGLLLHTGDPGAKPRSTREQKAAALGQEYDSDSAIDPSLRMGALYVGYGIYKVGWNSDRIRHVFQNKGVHDHFPGGPLPWFNIYNKTELPGRPYFDLNNNNPFSLWGY